MDGSKAAQLLQYVARGWALVPLHDVSTGVCSCGVAGCKSAGKHPRAREWQRPEHLVLDAAGLARWPAESNWGLATGVISGVWAVDYDPKAVTDPAAAGAFLLRLQEGGTWTQRTGSGGQHWVFALPDDFVPNNSARRLPDGFDVRGARRGEVSGGQIVLTPSVSGVGPYIVLGDPAAAARPAPADVVELVRPAVPRVRRDASWSLPTGSSAVAAYVTAGIAKELIKLRGASVRRNDLAVQVAYRVLELANTGLVDREAAYQAWWSAAAAHPDPEITVPDRELLSVWGSAERHVGDRPADLSGVGGAPSWMGGAGVGPFAVPAAAPPLGLSGSTDGPGSAVDVDPVAAMIARMLTPERMREQQPPEPLINELLDFDSAAWLIGKSGAFKSFVALDWAAHIGRGEAWRGHGVRQGLVVYVVAEGARGMRLRVDAWEREYGPLKDVLFLPEPVQADERGAERRGLIGEWSVLAEACRRLGPVLVIIDTQARVTIGLKENDNGDMSYYAAQADRIRKACGACVLTVHHVGRSSDNARGASSIDGAQDAELKVERVGTFGIRLISDKQKDQAQSAPIAFNVRRSEGGVDPNTGRDLSSLVIEHGEVPVLAEAGIVAPAWRLRAIALYQMIRDYWNIGEGGTRAELRTMFRGLAEVSDMAKATQDKAWARAWGELLARGLVARRMGAERFKIIVIPNQAAEGVLTPNDRGFAGTMPPDGWNVHWTDDGDEPPVVLTSA